MSAVASPVAAGSAGERSGLSQAEAADRLRREGANELPSHEPRGLAAIVLGVARQPMFLLLLAAGAVYLLLGDVREALMLLGFVVVVIAITLSQERKTEHALAALRDLSSPRALVVRDGQRQRIPGREVVRGDLVVLVEGDRVPADAVVVESAALSADESLLTGESVPVAKSAAVAWPAGGAPPQMPPPGGDGLPVVFSGTLVVRGHGLAVVAATGQNTAIGGIGRALQSVAEEPTPLQHEIDRLVRLLAIGGVALCAVVVAAYGLAGHGWLDGLLAGITLAMAVLPEEFPVILTVFLALGAWRMSQQRVLTRRVPAIEALGAATVLCVDKTGTLTQNRMTAVAAAVDGRILDVAATLQGEGTRRLLQPLARMAVSASLDDPFDPMERALHDFAAAAGLVTHGAAERRWQELREYPLRPGALLMARAWTAPGGGAVWLTAKGAPEAIATACAMDESQRAQAASATAEMAERGLRVLGVAHAELPAGTPLPDTLEDAPALHFDGLVGLADPLRDTVPAAVEDCRRAGISVVMITGDYPVTAASIARQAGLADGAHIVTGDELRAMDDDALDRRIGGVSVFARVVPEQKLRIVQALRRRGEVVAMTGDGVNDAPALKAAHIGVAMGGRGADVARESAALVLLDDDFTSIVRAVRLGRRIFDNLSKAMAYVLAVHVPIAGLSLFPVLLGWPLVLMPAHIVFLELVIDPACSVAFEAEPEEPTVMRRPPRDPRRPLFAGRTLGVSALQGTAVLAVLMVALRLSMLAGMTEDESRAIVFTGLVLANLGLILSNRSWSHSIAATLRMPNRALWSVLGGASAVLAAVLGIPALRSLFHFAALQGVDVLWGVAAGAACIVAVELTKLLHHHGPHLRR